MPSAERVSNKKRILQAAVGVLASGGIADLTIARVARVAGVSPSLVHYHFDTAESLLALALEHSYDVAGTARVAEGDADVTARERLLSKVEANLPLPGTQRHQWELWVELWLQAARDESLQRTAIAVYYRLHQALHDLLVEVAADEDRDLRDASASADRILAAFDGFGIRTLLDPGHLAVDRMRTEVLRVVHHELEWPFATDGIEV